MTRTRATIPRITATAALAACILVLSSCADTRAAILVKVGAKPPGLDINADITLRPGLFVAQNKDGFGWENVVVKLTDSRHSTEFFLRERMIAPMDSLRAEPWRFRRFTGRGPNPLNSPGLIVTITCDTPKGPGSWSGRIHTAKRSMRRSAES